MKKLTLLSIIGISAILTACGDNYPKISQLDGSEEHLITSIRQYLDSGNSLPENFWKDWEDVTPYSHTIRKILEKNNIIKGNEYSPEYKEYLLNISSTSTPLGSVARKIQVCLDDDGYKQRRLCQLTIDKLIELDTPKL
ncbi:hypothetical protein JFL47_03080 [Haemophilus haemoglobinophilus]|nr:hypothetical protein [Canicola haemoglobinophilus]